jgi:hypothetical protein
MRSEAQQHRARPDSSISGFAKHAVLRTCPVRVNGSPCQKLSIGWLEQQIESSGAGNNGQAIADTQQNKQMQSFLPKC